MEFIHNHLKAKTLFATHYHELIELAGRLISAKNLCVDVRENEKDGVVFLYKLREGGVDKSYGIEVAKLAGLPLEVILRARGVLNELEKKQIKQKTISRDQMYLFKENKPRKHSKIDEKSDEIIKEINKIAIEKITPLEAMQKLDELKRKTKK